MFEYTSHLNRPHGFIQIIPAIFNGIATCNFQWRVQYQFANFNFQLYPMKKVFGKDSVMPGHSGWPLPLEK